MIGAPAPHFAHRLLNIALLLLLFVPLGAGVSYADDATPSYSCSADLTTEAVYQSMKTCWACPLFEGVMQVSEKLGRAMSGPDGNPSRFAAGISRILAIALAIYILIEVGKLMLPFGSIEKARDVGGQLWLKLLICLVCILMIRNYSVYWDYIYTPITNSAIRTSTAMLQAGMQVTQGKSGDYAKGLDAIPAFDPNQPEKGMSAQIGALQQNLGIGVVIGWASLQALFGNGMESAFGNILPAIGGIIIALVYALAILIFPIYMIDAVIRWSIVNIMAPFFIGCFVFKVTRPTAERAFRSIVHSALTLVFLSLIVAFSGVMMHTIVQGAIANGLAGGGGAGSGGGGAGGGASLCTLIQGASKGAGMGALTSPIVPGFWMLLALGLLIIRTVGTASQYAADFVGAIGSEGDPLNRANELANKLKGAVVAAAAAMTAGAIGLAGGAMAAGGQALAAKGGAAAAKAGEALKTAGKIADQASKVAEKAGNAAKQISKQTDS
ncbi:MAG: type IV secretion system protein [Holosporaceae bacterium]